MAEDRLTGSGAGAVPSVHDQAAKRLLPFLFRGIHVSWRYYVAMVRREVIEAYASAVAEAFAPERIVLFGSHAKGTPHADSDADLLVVMDHDKANLAVKTMQRCREEIREGKVLYEAA